MDQQMNKPQLLNDGNLSLFKLKSDQLHPCYYPLLPPDYTHIDKHAGNDSYCSLLYSAKLRP